MKHVTNIVYCTVEIDKQQQTHTTFTQKQTWDGFGTLQLEYCHCDKKLARLPCQLKQITCSAHAEGSWRWVKGAVTAPQAASDRGSECGNRISGANFLIMFHSNYGSNLLSFRHMTTGWTMDEGQRTLRDQHRQLKHKCLLRSSSLCSAICRYRPHRGRFWDISASGSVRWCCFRSCWTVLSHVMRRRPGCLLQSAGGETNRILLTPALLSMHIICINRVSRRDWIIAVSFGLLR